MYKQFTRENRVALAALLRIGISPKKCGQELGFDKSTITKEVARNKDTDGAYRGASAHRKYLDRRRIAKRPSRKIENNKNLQAHIKKRLKVKDSPEQIAGRLKEEMSLNTVCHETIYQWIFHKQPKLKKQLRRIGSKGKYRRKRGTKQREKVREALKIKRIDTRPPIVEERSRVGDFEGDTVIGKNTSDRLLTNVDRLSGYGMIDLELSATAEKLRTKLQDRFRRLPKEKRYTYTYDNGTEIGKEDSDLEKKIGMDVYRAYPYHSWERGTNENYNGLVRDFFPKRTDFATLKTSDVKRVERILNHRPRKRLGYLTPHEVFVLGREVSGAVQGRM
jgi:transposase, IS30 family